MQSFYSPSQLARQLSLDRKTIYRAIERGDLRAVRIGASLRVSEDDFQNWIERSVV